MLVVFLRKVLEVFAIYLSLKKTVFMLKSGERRGEGLTAGVLLWYAKIDEEELACKQKTSLLACRYP